MQYDLAIELGSINTVICKRNFGVILKEPSLVSVSYVAKTKSIQHVGLEAKKLIGSNLENVEIFEPVVEGVIINKQFAFFMLKEFLKKCDLGNLSKLKVAFCVPVGITEKEKNMLLSLAYQFNFHSIGLVYSSIASLVGMEIDVTKPNSHMVLTLGGGVSDVSIVSRGEIVRGGSVNISGKSLSNAITNHLLEKHSIIISQIEKEEILKYLASILPNDRNELKINGVDLDTKRQKSVTLKAKEIQPIIITYAEKLVEIVEALINLSSSEVVADIKKYGIYVCGGLSNLTGMDRFLSESLKYPVYIDTNPEKTITYGLCEIIENDMLLSMVLQDEK